MGQSIEPKLVQHIAKLARLRIEDDKIVEFSAQLTKVMGYFEQISQIQTEGVVPMVTPTEIEEFWREDVIVKEYSADEMTANAPSKLGNLFKVPPVV